MQQDADGDARRDQPGHIDPAHRFGGDEGDQQAKIEQTLAQAGPGVGLEAARPQEFAQEIAFDRFVSGPAIAIYRGGDRSGVEGNIKSLSTCGEGPRRAG